MWKIKIRGGHRCLIVLPAVLRRDVFRGLHASRGHLGLKKTLHRAREKLKGSITIGRNGTHNFIREGILRCSECIQEKKPRRKGGAPIQVYNEEAPMERIAMDILGSLSRSDKVNRYCCVLIGNYFSKWVTAAAVPDQEASTMIAQALIDNVSSIIV